MCEIISLILIFVYSEWNDECIDFTMLAVNDVCWFFILYVYTTQEL